VVYVAGKPRVIGGKVATGYGPVRRGGAAWWSEGAVAVVVVVVVGSVVTVVVGNVAGGIALRVVVAVGPAGTLGSRGAGSFREAPHP
jgi:hypothetical protein